MRVINFLNNNDPMPIYWYRLDCYNIMPNMYEINIYGNIRYTHTKRLVHVFYHNFNYPQANLLTINHTTYPFLIHRLVAETFICRTYADKNIINHIDNNSKNCFMDNLEWCNQKENVHHAIRMGTFRVVGDENPNARLSDEQVHLICKYMEQGLKYSDILKNIGLPASKWNLDILTKIRSKKLWNHISQLYNIPQKEYRAVQTIYTNDQIHIMCRMLQDNKTIRQIAEYFNIDCTNRKETGKFWHFMKRIRDRKTYTNISCNYNW